MTLRTAERRLLHGWPLGAGPHTRELRMLNLLGLSTLAGYSTPLTTLSSGGLLAFVSMPAFDPNSFSEGIGRTEWKMLSENDHITLLNKVAQGLYPS